jgi:hypothetical protein
MVDLLVCGGVLFSFLNIGIHRSRSYGLGLIQVGESLLDNIF